LLADRSLVRDASLLESRFARGALEPRRHAVYSDGLYDAERGLLRDRADLLTARFDEEGAPDDERTFYNLLVNHLIIRGLRAQEELNDRVMQFRRRFPSSPLAPVAEQYIARPYAEAPFGA